MPKRILVCLDGSRLSDQIVPRLAEVATPRSTEVVLFRGKYGGVTGVSKNTPWSMLHRGKGQNLRKTSQNAGNRD